MSYIVANRPGSASAVIGPGPGPATSTDNAVARWDGTTGTAIQNSGVIIDDSNNVTGVASLTVTTLVATTTVTTGDNIIRLNDDVVGAPTEDAGIEVERGSSTDATLLWDETNDYWVAGLVGSTARILLAGDDHGLLGGLGDDDHVQYHTDARALTWLGTRSTTDLPEGSNLYFTDERAQDAVGSIIADSVDIDFTYDDGAPSITGVLTTTGVSAASYGSATQVATFTVDTKGRLSAAANVAIAITSSAVTDFNEAAQDAVGGILTDSASIDFTYNDGANTISAVVLPAGVDHNSLANLATGDVHTHYALLAGRSGGQTLIGGTASGNGLTLQSTSNATRGKIFFGSAQLTAFDEVNSRFGVGTASPSAKFHVTETATTGTVVPSFLVASAAHTALTASTERIDANFNGARTVQWSTGALTTQRFNLFQAPTIGFVGASTVTNTATVAITGAPVKGTNATLSNTHALLIQAGAVSTATNSYGLSVNAQTGATNNYAAQFMGGNVGIGTASPASRLTVETGGSEQAILAGSGGSTSGNNSSILAGASSYAYGNNSAVLAGQVNGVIGENEACLAGNSYLSGYEGAVGAGLSEIFNSQWGRLALQYQMTVADGTTFKEVVAPQKFSINSGGAYAVNVRISGMQSDGSNGAYYQRMVLIKNVSGTTSLVGAVQTVGTDIESDAAWDVQLTADNANDVLKIEVKGNSQDINWLVQIDYMFYLFENIA